MKNEVADMDWNKYLRKDGYLNTHKFKVLKLSDEYKILVSKYFWPNSIGELYYCDINNIIEQPRCYCGKIVGYNTVNRYFKYCSYKCSAISDETKHSREVTNIKKYGVNNISQLNVIKNRKKKTSLKNYGVEHPSQNTQIKNKIKRTYLETCLKKYGCYNVSARHISEDMRQMIDDKNFLSYQHNILMKPLYQIADEIGISASYMSRIYYVLGIVVRDMGISVGEKQLYDYICCSCQMDVIPNDRIVLNPYELDIYIPELKLAFEYDGEYWHNNKRERDRWKTFRCRELGITLYHIHDRYWIHDQERIKRAICKIIGNRLTSHNAIV